MSEIDAGRVIDLLTERVARVLGRPAAESMRDAALLEAQLHGVREGDDGEAE